MIPVFAVEVVAPILLFIGITFAIIPFLTPPYIQFGIRIYNDPNDLPLPKYRMEFAAISIVISVAMIFLFLLESDMAQTLLISLSPLIQIFTLFIVYFAYHYRVLSIRGKAEDTGNHETASAFILKDEGSFRYLFLVVPWIFLLIYIIIGLLYYISIPETFPIHFNSNGIPNQYATKSVLSVFSILIFVGIPTTALLEIIAIAILRAKPFQNPANPVKTSVQMTGFNRINSTMILLVAITIQLTLFLSSATTWDLIPHQYVLLTVLPVIVSLPIILIVSLRTGQTGWKLYPGSNETRQQVTPRNDDANWKD